jgi:hypothetical protein
MLTTSSDPNHQPPEHHPYQPNPHTTRPPNDPLSISDKSLARFLQENQPGMFGSLDMSQSFYFKGLEMYGYLARVNAIEIVSCNSCALYNIAYNILES